MLKKHKFIFKMKSSKSALFVDNDGYDDEECDDDSDGDDDNDDGG